MALTPSFKPLAMADLRLTSTRTLSLASITSSFTLAPSSEPLCIVRLSSSHQSTAPFFSLAARKQNKMLLVPLVASQTSDWAQQEEEAQTETGLSEWEGEGEGEGEVEVEGQEDGEVVAEAESGFEEGEEESFPEPPEEAKLFVGNIPFDMDSEKLAQLFDEAGVVEVAEVIYNRETDQSRGFGFVTMSTIEEAEKAVEMFHRYEVNGRALTVNKAAPRGARVERSFEPACRIYVGNLPWSVDDARLVQIFSEHGKVKDARVVSDRESGRSRGFGFVIMESQSEMDDAIAALDGQTLDGRALRVNVAEERPRRSSF